MDAGSSVGMLILNSLSLPRASTGDSAVYWAESLAEGGYPTFRIDIPGLGDSDGVLPVELLDFINAGGFGSAASEAVRELVERFNLASSGHCAGVPSAFAAEKRLQCRGLVLMDPVFSPRRRRCTEGASKAERLGSRYTTVELHNVYDQLRKFYRRPRGSRLPSNANFALLKCWKDVASKGPPIFLLKAPARKAFGAKPRAGEFDYLQYVLKLAGAVAR